jgi:asparagine synthase (glutamine-hydrolysing)
MCGITGIFETRNRADISRDLLARMNESQHHRGPDEGSYHIEPGVGFGHRRLSIIDIATGQQPLFNEDGSVAVIFNGEIYNFQELIPELTALGHVSEPRAIPSDRARMGRGALHYRTVQGDVRIRWDRIGRRSSCPDRLGVKPLITRFFGWQADIWFELKSLLVHGGFSLDLDPQAVEEYFALGYVPEPRTIFAGVMKLAPGHTILFRRGVPSTGQKQYWDVRFTLDNRLSEADACEELIARLRESVRLRLISEVPLGAFFPAASIRARRRAMWRCFIGPGHHLFDSILRSGVR